MLQCCRIMVNGRRFSDVTAPKLSLHCGKLGLIGNLQTFAGVSGVDIRHILHCNKRRALQYSLLERYCGFRLFRW